ncbi:MAG: hypothetical protein AAB225_17435 [Acidobacteriota bacterium]
MPETLQKLRPDRDLQCYFERPSAIAALSEASAGGFTISGSFRQQFDWAVLDWNRDNVFEHPAFRNLPDGDLSGLVLSYEETRVNCVPVDSDLYPTIDWPYLRIWAEDQGAESIYKVRLKNYATAVEGAYQPATAEFELRGSVTPGDYAGLAWLTEHHTCQIVAGDTPETVAQRIVESVEAFSPTTRATRSGARIRLTYVGVGQTPENSTTGANGNRVGAYGHVSGAMTEWWEPQWQRFSGGASPTKWRITLNFGALTDTLGRTAPMTAVRKVRWTYAADMQAGAFARCEFQVRVTNWAVNGTGKGYTAPGPGSRRIEDDAPEITYTGNWAASKGNFSGGSIHYTSSAAARLSCTYEAAGTHTLYLGARRADNGGQVAVKVDGGAERTLDLRIPGEDALVRLKIGEYGGGSHAVEIRSLGPEGRYFYFDFLEIAVPAQALPAIAADAKNALATDWDTDHSMALAPERTAWMIHSLGFHGRVNHYVGALWFYELCRAGHQYASATVEFTGTPEFSAVTAIRIGRTDEPPENDTILQHLNLIGDTAETIARAFELEINRGYMAIRAAVSGAVLTIYARAMGAEGNKITLAASPTSGAFVAQASGPTLAGGADGDWRTDLAATPRLNRAARDWHVSFYRALHGYGLDAVSALSMEIQHGDPSAEAGIAQRYPDGAPALLNTPALQTNFSPASLAFWKEAHRELADLMQQAGLQPYLQFGEAQWWYFPNASGMPYYDAHTKDTFRATYGREMSVIARNDALPALHPEEAAFLPGLIGAFTNQIIAHVRQTLPGCRFEVLYPHDVNEPAFNKAVNLPAASWGPATLDCFKTESFLHTYARNLDKSLESISVSKGLGFPHHKRAHLIGISDYTTAWPKELMLGRAEGLESVVLFALDQFSLIGYPAPVRPGMRRAVYLGG